MCSMNTLNSYLAEAHRADLHRSARRLPPARPPLGPPFMDHALVATRVSSARFVGRTAELAELRSALAEAVAGRPALAFVAGESGVGKTRLVCELERSARADGVRVLSGECVDLGEGELAFAPIVAALRPLARAQDPVLDGLPALRSMLPGLATEAAERGFSEEATGARAQLFEALLTLIDRLGARRRPAADRSRTCTGPTARRAPSSPTSPRR